MPRNSNGDYSLPAGNPVVTGTVISSSWANSTTSDIATALTGSLARNGDGGMTGQFKADAGVIGAPGISWSLETTSGWRRASAGNFRFTIGGSDVVTVTASGFAVTGLLSASAGLTVSGGAITLPDASIADAALSSNVPLKNAANTFTAAQTVTVAGDGNHLLVGNGTVTVPIGFFSGAAYIGTIGAHGFSLITGGNSRVTVASGGNVSIAAPSSGITLTTNIAAAAAAEVQRWSDGTRLASLYLSNSTTPVQFGSSGALLLFSNTGVNGMTLDTGLQIGSPTGGDKGADTINAAGDVHVNGEPLALRNLLRRVITGTDSSATGDAGRSIYYTGTGGHTLTLDTDPPVTSVVMIVNAGSGNLTLAASSTLYWFNGTSLPTGSRTLTPGAIVTAWQTSSGVWECWGTGIS